jgi:hypothetical protein
MRSAAVPATPTVCIVGAGPRGTSILERLCANAASLLGPAQLRIHLVDLHPAGPGRIWRRQQSGLMWSNTTAADNTIFPDSSVTCDGPVDVGPSFLEWAGSEGRRLLAGTDLGEEAARVHPGWFPSRHLYSEYLTWTLERAAASAPPGVTVECHAGRVVDLTDGDGRQLVWLEGEDEPLVADVVILAQGHHDVSPDAEEAALANFAATHGLAYLPRAYSADADLDRFAPGEPVIVRGAGLAFVDCMVLLFEGRGGRYRRAKDGRLEYLPSGAEPRLLVGSRRGVPYHSKTTYPLVGPRPPLPHFLTADVLAELHGRVGALDFVAHLQPLVAAELAFGYYHELWHGHPERVAGTWEDFAAGLAGGEPGTSGPAGGGLGGRLDPALVAAAVPDPADRLDLGWLERPLDGLAAADPTALQAYLRRYIDADLARRTDPAHSADLGMIFALLSCFGTLAVAAGRGLLSARSLALVDGSFFGFFSYIASGPPPPRLEQLAALSRAGVVEFLGADTAVRADPVRGCFVATRAVGPPVEAPALLDARLPAPSVAHSGDPLVARLHARGEVREDVRRDERDGFVLATGRLLTDPEHHVIDAQGVVQPARYALGPWTTGGRFSSGIARPRLNGTFFRQNDALARAVLAQVTLDQPASHVPIPSP